AYRTTATSALQVILGIPPLYLQLQQDARITAIRRLNRIPISLPYTLTTLVPGEVEKGETGWAAHPAECPSEEQISLVDNIGNPHLHGWLEDRKRCRGGILRLIRTKYSLQMAGKTARLQYSFPGGTSGLETRNRPCNQPPSRANNHSSEQSGECPGSS
ncbi:hypothetical protein AVEN_54840-1, partial [Araneus ventricosus]